MLFEFRLPIKKACSVCKQNTLKIIAIYAITHLYLVIPRATRCVKKNLFTVEVPTYEGTHHKTRG